MIHESHGKQVKSSVIFHLSRPVKALIRRFSFAILVLLAIFTVFVSKTDSPFTKSVRVAVADAVSPVTYALSIPFSLLADWNQSFSSYFFVHSKNEKLKKENEILRRQLITLSQVGVENEGLKDLLNFVEELQYSYISTKVVGDVSGPFVRSILVNAGKKDKVKKGQAVVGEKGLIGRIIEVGTNSSRILLVTDINSKIPVISSLSRERSVLLGNNTQDPKLVYLPKDSNVKDGEVIVTSGDGEFFPPGIPIGKVYSDADGSFNVQPFMKWHRLEHLSVLDYSYSRMANSRY